MKLEHLAPYLPYGLKYFSKSLNRDREFSWATIEEFILTQGKCKLYLRPLSNLTREIEHNGETFVPVNILTKDYLNAEKELLPLLKGDYENMTYSIIEKLLEWHFDVFGLIEKGEAIKK